MKLNFKSLLSLALLSATITVAQADVNIDFKCNNVSSGLLFGFFSADAPAGALVPQVKTIMTSWLSMNKDSNWFFSSLYSGMGRHNFLITGALNTVKFTADEFKQNHIQIDIINNSIPGSCKAVKTLKPLSAEEYATNANQ